MHLMNQHIGDLTILDHAYSQNYESDEHARQHRWVTLIEWVFADKVKKNAHWDQIFQIQLEHAPPFGPVVIH